MNSFDKIKKLKSSANKTRIKNNIKVNYKHCRKILEKKSKA